MHEGEVELTVNGSPRRLPAGTSVAALVASLGRDRRAVAVELNGRILPRDLYDATELAPGDRIEVVQFVQGG